MGMGGPGLQGRGRPGALVALCLKGMRQTRHRPVPECRVPPQFQTLPRPVDQVGSPDSGPLPLMSGLRARLLHYAWVVKLSGCSHVPSVPTSSFGLGVVLSWPRLVRYSAVAKEEIDANVVCSCSASDSVSYGC